MDDQDMMREVAEAMLDEIGCDTVHARDGLEAIELYKAAIAEQKPVDLVLMDLTVPAGMGGDEAVKEIIAIDKDALVVACSGHPVDTIKARYEGFGFSDVLSKPYDFQMLEDLIKTMLDR